MVDALLAAEHVALLQVLLECVAHLLLLSNTACHYTNLKLFIECLDGNIHLTSDSFLDVFCLYCNSDQPGRECKYRPGCLYFNQNYSEIGLH